MQNCPKCGSTNVVMVGWDDGGGDYGDMICETYTCDACEYMWDGVCVEEEIPNYEEV